ncbi:MAG: carbonic anhydrase [Candidatus Komeilibacteria bacterium]|nr:carbonic anhydrase [Candidatus Komeilibacteria bacterium]
MNNETMQKLLDGNSRFAAGTAIKPNQNQKRRAELVQAQHPEAIIVSCSDSRVSPEIIFDQGLGDLFVVRTAGHVIDDAVLASIEYAAEHLHTQLIVVLGHKNCGAVKATIDGGELPGHLGGLTKAIANAVETALTQDGDLFVNAVTANINTVVKQLKSSEPILAELVKNNKLDIVGACYDLESGVVGLVE